MFFPRFALPVLVFAAISAGCSASVSYTPTASMSQQQAAAVITRCLEEQPTKLAPTSVTVSPTKLSIEKVRSGRFLRGSSRSVTTFYFESLGKMELTERRLGNVVKVWDAGEVFRFMVVISDPALAKRFMDAMTSMAKATP